MTPKFHINKGWYITINILVSHVFNTWEGIFKICCAIFWHLSKDYKIHIWIHNTILLNIVSYSSVWGVKIKIALKAFPKQEIQSHWKKKWFMCIHNSDTIKIQEWNSSGHLNVLHLKKQMSVMAREHGFIYNT